MSSFVPIWEKNLIIGTINYFCLSVIYIIYIILLFKLKNFLMSTDNTIENYT